MNEQHCVPGVLHFYSPPHEPGGICKCRMTMLDIDINAASIPLKDGRCGGCYEPWDIHPHARCRLTILGVRR